MAVGHEMSVGRHASKNPAGPTIGLAFHVQIAALLAPDLREVPVKLVGFSVTGSGTVYAFTLCIGSPPYWRDSGYKFLRSMVHSLLLVGPWWLR